MADDPVLMGISIAVLCLLGLFFLLGVRSVVRERRGRKEVEGCHEDDNGISTPDAAEVSGANVPKACILLFATAGTIMSLVTAIATATREEPESGFSVWSGFGAWALLLLQAICVASCRSHRAAYRLGACLAFSCLVLAAVFALESANMVRASAFDSWFYTYHSLRIAALVCLASASLSLHPRPDTVHNGCQVDRYDTSSFLSRVSWSWADGVLRAAAEKNDLDMVDLPKLGLTYRARDREARWDGRHFQGPLWRCLLSYYRPTILLQWIATVIGSLLSFAPQWCVLQLLRVLEKGTGWESRVSEAWVWAAWIAVAIALQSWVETWMIWTSQAKLGLPVRTQLSSLVCQKSMRMKCTGGTGEIARDAETSGDGKPQHSPGSAPVKSPGSDSQQSGERSRGESLPDNRPPNELPTKALQNTMNLMAVDVERVSRLASLNHYLPGSLFKLVVSVVLLLDLLGWQALAAGALVVVVITPVNAYFTKRYFESQEKLTAVRDEKTEIVSEALQGIRQIKFSALEPFWEQKIGAIRTRELGSLRAVFFNDIFLLGCWVATPIVVSAASLAVNAAIHGNLLPSAAFVSLAVFRALEVTLSAVPELVTCLSDAWVSVGRLDAFLEGEELPETFEEADAVSFRDATIAWPTDPPESDPARFRLAKVNVSFPAGELTVLSGPTGSGKSLLLAAIMGEADVLSGAVARPRAPTTSERRDDKAHRGNWILPGAMAVVTQNPWLENATVKENILFGLPYDEVRFYAVIDACALPNDLAALVDGEQTEVGANGTNLSGGQKWRIALARAVYSRAGVLVLDDIFSAVDAHVGRHLFEACLLGGLAAGRTRILVTHHTGLCEASAQLVIRLGHGGVLSTRTKAAPAENGNQRIHATLPAIGTAGSFRRPTATASLLETEQLASEHQRALASTAAKLPHRKLVEDELHEQGVTKRHVYKAYFGNGGGWVFWLSTILFFVGVQALTVGRSWWLRIWTAASERDISMHASTHAFTYAVHLQQLSAPQNMQLSSAPERSVGFYLGLYILLAVSSALLSTLRYYWVFAGSLRVSQKLFGQMNATVLRAPLRWLDTVPVGRVLNRYTSDFNSLDTHLAYAVAYSASFLLELLGVVAAGWLVSPAVLGVAALLLAISATFAVRYLPGARSVKRLESTARSPVFEQLSSALNGIATIRGFDRTALLLDRMSSKLDAWATATWHLWLFNCWLQWRLSLVASVFTSVVAGIVLLHPNIDAALGGFALTFALEFSSVLMVTIYQYTNVELGMNAVERIVEYTELPTENPQGTLVPAHWPSEGRIEVDELVVAYDAGLPPVIKGLSFHVGASERVGVVGRTGAGKSTLALALFRFLEARSGTVLIDGINTAQMRLRDLRSRLAIIPQDPVLFKGTVRSNLDPFHQHTDAELRDSLRRVRLLAEDGPSAPLGRPAVESEPSTQVESAPSAQTEQSRAFCDLAWPVSEGGRNLSQGQRQLLCLARAIVSRPKILVLDEATSAVDKATDALIQQSIRAEFVGCTLLVVAHRLSTVADFDKILVMQDGRAAEYGTPRELWELDEGQGRFRGMCERSGERDMLWAMCLGSL